MIDMLLWDAVNVVLESLPTGATCHVFEFYGVCVYRSIMLG